MRRSACKWALPVTVVMVDGSIVRRPTEWLHMHPLLNAPRDSDYLVSMPWRYDFRERWWVHQDSILGPWDYL